jgi:dihydropteroate synthase
LPELSKLGYPLLVGTSRKSFIAHILRTQSQQASESDNRTWGTAATVAASIMQGAHIVRVHDVAEMLQVARVTDAILSPRSLAEKETSRR